MRNGHNIMVTADLESNSFEILSNLFVFALLLAYYNGQDDDMAC